MMITVGARSLNESSLRSKTERAWQFCRESDLGRRSRSRVTCQDDKISHSTRARRKKPSCGKGGQDWLPIRLGVGPEASDKRSEAGIRSCVSGVPLQTSQRRSPDGTRCLRFFRCKMRRRRGWELGLGQIKIPAANGGRVGNKFHGRAFFGASLNRVSVTRDGLASLKAGACHVGLPHCLLW